MDGLDRLLGAMESVVLALLVLLTSLVSYMSYMSFMLTLSYSMRLQSQRLKLKQVRQRLLLRSVAMCLCGATPLAIPSQLFIGRVRTEIADYQTATSSSGYLLMS